MNSKYVTPGEIARETALPRATVYKLIHQGRIPGAYNFNPGGNTGLRVLRSEYERWRERCKLSFPGRPLAD